MNRIEVGLCNLQDVEGCGSDGAMDAVESSVTAALEQEYPGVDVCVTVNRRPWEHSGLYVKVDGEHLRRDEATDEEYELLWFIERAEARAIEDGNW